MLEFYIDIKKTYYTIFCLKYIHMFAILGEYPGEVGGEGEAGGGGPSEKGEHRRNRRTGGRPGGRTGGQGKLNYPSL